MELVERLNAYSASIGVGVMNLKITDVMAPEEMEEADNDAVESRGRTRKRSLVVDDYFTSPALKNISGPELRARTAVVKSVEQQNPPSASDHCNSA
ncbi:hypothetical protein PsorP6_014702 [Peronosclerospora sorghi]|uniref:Uncharacterized protein n=1 Tax=Peronosclerospora sorghi TaxID=230839 RepID=A0ACC0VR24_9STRA|nr:hypothetical protein PsorP6_014702 [Peronosclerospora sorghi]